MLVFNYFTHTLHIKNRNEMRPQTIKSIEIRSRGGENYLALKL